MSLVAKNMSLVAKIISLVANNSSLEANVASLAMTWSLLDIKRLIIGATLFTGALPSGKCINNDFEISVVSKSLGMIDAYREWLVLIDRKFYNHF